MEAAQTDVHLSFTPQCRCIFFFVFMEVKGRLFANLREVSRVNKFDNTATAHVLFINKT